LTSCPLTFHLFDSAGTELNLLTGLAPSYLDGVATFLVSGNYTYEYTTSTLSDTSDRYPLEIDFCRTTTWLPYEPATIFDGLDVIIPVANDSIAIQIDDIMMCEKTLHLFDD